jgi:phage tail-like protein
MDANGARFWLLADARHFAARSRTVWDADCRVLKLASERTLPPPADVAASRAAAMSAMEVIPSALDSHGSLARWIEEADDEGNVGLIGVQTPHLPDEAILMRLPTRPTDLAAGHDGVLYIALPDGILMHDLRGRWPDERVRLADFTPWRIAADERGGIWIIERASGRLARLDGLPLPQRPYPDYAHTTFRPSPENPCPPLIRVLDRIEWPVGERPQAIASHPQGGIALLTWAGSGIAHLRVLNQEEQMLGEAIELVGARHAYSLTWIDAAEIAVRMPGRRDAPAFALEDGEDDLARAPLGDIYPLAQQMVEAPFVHRLQGPAHYPIAASAVSRGARALHRLSLANIARHGQASNADGDDSYLLDSGSQQTVWHRLYAEASLPPGAGMIVWLAATSEPEAPTDANAWCAHRFGRSIPVPPGPHEPQAAWEAQASELPAHPGLGPWPVERDRAGLFSVLVQDPRYRVRALSGRYLWVRLEMFGDGRVGPEVAALRIWANRFSYRDQYLPRLYRETLHGAPALLPGDQLGEIDDDAVAQLNLGGNAAPALVTQLRQAGASIGPASEIRVIDPGDAWRVDDRASGRSLQLRRDALTDAITLYRPAATPADFLERFLCNFEGMLTPLEDRVAGAHLLTHPHSTPEASLDWLGAWIGIAFDPALPAERRREWLAAAPELARYHGTAKGLALALDLATGGGVRGGEIILLENFRLRRLFATLLGVDLADEKDPLLPGLTVSGNSIVGDTLILSDTEKIELLALFREEVASFEENQAVLAFYDQLAHRASVLVHQSIEPQDLGLIRRIVELESPAHVEVTILTATWPLLTGVSSLVGVDTYLGPPPQPRPARIEVSGIGMGDYIMGPTSLDPRASGAAAPPVPSQPPTANLGPDFAVPVDVSFLLDGSASSAAPGREIRSYTWRRLPPQT